MTIKSSCLSAAVISATCFIRFQIGTYRGSTVLLGQRNEGSAADEWPAGGVTGLSLLRRASSAGLEVTLRSSDFGGDGSDDLSETIEAWDRLVGNIAAAMSEWMWSSAPL